MLLTYTIFFQDYPYPQIDFFILLPCFDLNNTSLFKILFTYQLKQKITTALM